MLFVPFCEHFVSNPLAQNAKGWATPCVDYAREIKTRPPLSHEREKIKDGVPSWYAGCGRNS